MGLGWGLVDGLGEVGRGFEVYEVWGLMSDSVL